MTGEGWLGRDRMTGWVTLTRQEEREVHHVSRPIVYCDGCTGHVAGNWA